jgi:hypothetical protein
MIKFLKSFFTKKEETVAEVPYKVETPAPSPVAAQASAAVVESIATAKPAAKKPAAKKQNFSKKPRATKPKAPKAPKA